ncbi:hypothetical protein HDV00_000485, partial [Rhizophlyctis rosea]
MFITTARRSVCQAVDFDQDRRRNIEAWWLIVSPWLSYLRGVKSDATRDLDPTGILIGIMACQCEEGLPPSTFDRLYQLLFGGESDTQDAYACRDQIATKELLFARENPRTYTKPLVMLDNEGKYVLHGAWSNFFEGHFPKYIGDEYEDISDEFLEQLREVLEGLIFQAFRTLQGNGLVVVEEVIEDVPHAVLEYRERFDADLARAATLPESEWPTMKLLADKLTKPERKYWCVFCKLFIRDGQVQPLTRINAA